MPAKIRPYIVSSSAFMFLMLPLFLSAQGIGIVPCTGLDCQFCSFASLVQNLIKFIIIVSIPIAGLLFAYAGFLYSTSSVGGTGNITKAHKIFSNVALGFVITLIGWLVINTGLSILLGNGPYSNGKWFEIPCTANRNTGTNTLGGILNRILVPAANLTSSGTGITSGGGVASLSGGTTGGSSGIGGECYAENQACSTGVLVAAGFTSAQASAMSCIAMSESSGNPSAMNGTHCGTFQIANSHWANLNIPGCSASNCTNANCNVQAAFKLGQNQVSRGHSRYSDWTCVTAAGKQCNPRALPCVLAYDPPTST